jgi:hypothetical protein
MAKRAQIMWSIWNLTVGRKSDRHWRLDELPKVFVRRANNLLERGVGIEEADRAGQRGVDHDYSLVDATELALGLDLMTLAWPQSEVAEFIAKNRRLLRNRIDGIDTKANNRTLLWIFPSPEFSPVLAAYEQAKPSLFYYVPQITTSEAEEQRQLGLFSVAARNRVVIDIGAIKLCLEENLAVAPVVRRGRQ